MLITIIICFSACKNEVNNYVSPQGNDANPGTKELPLASLNGAKNYVRKIKSSTSGAITVWFRGVDYYLDETVVFGLYMTLKDVCQGQGLKDLYLLPYRLKSYQIQRIGISHILNQGDYFSKN